VHADTTTQQKLAPPTEVPPTKPAVEKVAEVPPEKPVGQYTRGFTLKGVALDETVFTVDHQSTESFHIGRNSADIDLDLGKYSAFRTVSHKHACIHFDHAKKQFVLVNFGRNGSRVNEVVVKDAHPLRTGDVIEIGRVKLTFSGY